MKPETARALTERQALMTLAALPDIGPITIRRLLDHFGTARAVLQASAPELAVVCSARRQSCILEWSRYFDPWAEEAALAERGATFVTQGERGYPALLKHLPDAPPGLYRLGTQEVSRPAVAFVGTRHASAYGLKVTRALVEGLCRHGVTIVSGLARGIDAEAHQAALDVGGRTVAVLGCGVDVVYPPQNRALYQTMVEKGALYSEFSLGRSADRQTFPQRNRLISGMADAVIVVESGAQGGSLITARFAAEQGRPVFAVPGRLDQPTSEGCHALIRDGATLITRFEDILEDLQGRQMPLALDLPTVTVSARPVPAPSNALQEAALAALGEVERRLYTALAGGDVLHADQLSDRLDLPPPQVSGSLLLLELNGLIAKRPDGTYERR